MHQGIGNKEIDVLHAHDRALREVWNFFNAWWDRFVRGRGCDIGGPILLVRELRADRVFVRY